MGRISSARIAQHAVIIPTQSTGAIASIAPELHCLHPTNLLVCPNRQHTNRENAQSRRILQKRIANKWRNSEVGRYTIDNHQKHNLGGTIEVPSLKRTTVANANTDRLNMGLDDLRSLCKTFGCDFAYIETAVRERVTTGMPVHSAITWAKSEVISRRANPVILADTETREAFA